jgi:hypothetical protein
MKCLLAILLFFLVIQTINAQTEEKEEEPKGKISGTFFMDYFYNVSRDTGFAHIPNAAITGNKDVNGLKIRRIFFTYDYKFNNKLSSRFRLESDEMNFTTNSDGNKANKFGVVVKDAFINWNYVGRHQLCAGIQNTSAFEVSERVWGNRYIEKTIMDVRNAVVPRDFGISLRGQFDSIGVFKYWLMYANGNAGLPEGDKYKRYYAMFEFTPFKNFSITVHGDYQSRSLTANKFIPDGTMKNDVLTGSFFVGYNLKDKFSVGVESYLRNVENGYALADSYDDLKGFGISIFGNYYFTPKISIFARFDRFDPNKNTDAKEDTRNLYIGGLAFKPVKNLIISPNVFVETYEEVGDIKIKNSVNARLTASWGF